MSLTCGTSPPSPTGSRDAIAAAEAELRLEQAVYGLDRLDERKLQALLAERLAPTTRSRREVHYPSTRGQKLTPPRACDLVLSPKGLPLRLDSAPPTLFDPADACASRRTRCGWR